MYKHNPCFDQTDMFFNGNYFSQLKDGCLSIFEKDGYRLTSFTEVERYIIYGDTLVLCNNKGLAMFNLRIASIKNAPHFYLLRTDYCLIPVIDSFELVVGESIRCFSIQKNSKRVPEVTVDGKAVELKWLGLASEWLGRMRSGQESKDFKVKIEKAVENYIKGV
jgi:hypothetical protein